MRQKILALSMRGGAARCAGYLGVIEVLEDEGIRIDMMIGSSMGSLIAYLYASGKSIDQIIEIANDVHTLSLISIDTLFKRSLFSLPKLRNLIKEYTEGQKIETTDIPIHIQSTNINQFEPHIFSEGNSTNAILASMAYPFLVPAVEIEGEYYVDGDVSSGFAADFLRDRGAEYVLGLSSGYNQEDIFKDDIAHRVSVPIMSYLTIQKLDMKLNPIDMHLDNLGKDVGFLDLSRVQELREYGYMIAQENMEEIKNKLFKSSIIDRTSK